MWSIVSLIAGGILCYGIADIYKSKSSQENNKGLSKGVLATVLGLAGIATANPVFESSLLSTIVSIVYVGFLTGFISHTFLKTKPEETVYNAELLPPEENSEEEKQQEQLKGIEGRKDTGMPLAVNHFADEREKYPVRYR